MTSPAKYKLLINLDCIVEGSISFVLTPPAVIIASAIGLTPETFKVKFCITSIILLLSLLVIEFTFLFSSILDNCITKPMIFFGNKSLNEFLKSLFAYFTKSF